MTLTRASDRVEPPKYKGTLNVFWYPEYFSFDAICGSIVVVIVVVVVVVIVVVVVVVAWLLSSVAESLAENDEEIGNKRSGLAEKGVDEV